LILRQRALFLFGLLLLGHAPAGASDWLETQIVIEELAESDDFAAATALGDQLLEQVREEFGDSSERLAESYSLLAKLFRDADEYEEAELHHLRALEIYESNEGPLSTSLIDPLVDLGDTYYAAGNPELALITYDDARNISRRSFGLLNQQQLGILEKMTATAIAMRDLDRAKELQFEATTVVQRFYGAGSLESLDAYFRYAAWLTARYAGGDARQVYFDIERSIKDDFNNDPLLQVRLLRTQAASLRSLRISSRPGNGIYNAGTEPVLLNDALKLLDRLDEPDTLLRAEVLLDLGDWNVAFGRYRDIAEPYREAWDLLEELENGSELQTAWFTELAMISAAPINSRVLSPDNDAPWGRVEIQFTIEIDGRTSDIEITKSEPSGLLDQAAARQIANSHFRPRMKDGELIASTGSVGWDFQYDPRHLDDEPIDDVAND